MLIQTILDGGGIRGLETLVILGKIMEKAFPGQDVKPCKVFDMIGGTSTGGYVKPTGLPFLVQLLTALSRQV
ncbi:hypothetical protein LZ30DRAFT_728644 [Colletotrichum cereale]|nr:hypothetical protein LZ30DRAFT_728644 [Colletotrichum cereale]